MARRLASNFRDLCGGNHLYLVDHRRGKYWLEGAQDLPYFRLDGTLLTVIAGRHGSPVQQGFKEGYRTDLASIPTRLLKSVLEPKKRRPWAGEEIDVDWAVFVYLEDEDGTLVPAYWFVSAVAYAAYLHDNGYSLELDPRAEVDARFLEVLTIGGVWSRHAMYLAVRLGGWPSYPHPPAEVTEDRILATEALDRWSGMTTAAMRFE